MHLPRLLVTRAMPKNVSNRAMRDYTALFNPDDTVLSADEIVARAHAHQAEAMLICSSDRISADLVARLPDGLRVIATFSVGHEHIDVAACKARGIVAANTPDVLTEATADTAMLLLLAAMRRAYEGDRLVRAGEWVGWHTTMLLGRDPRGKRLGIYGMGRIGQAVAQRARAFGMQIHYHNRRRLPPGQEQGAAYHDSLGGLLRVCDALSINAPSTPETRGLFNAETLALLPEGAYFVNTARGDMVDDEALIAALKSGHIRAAGLDVFAGEPKLHPGYAALPNVFLLPHLGSATEETRDAMGFAALDNIDAVLQGRTPPSPL
ncbi:D-glycerate dehydrogenase [Ferrovibrio sp.]|uniref:2-hydroxyacid dehydrogenase n=1 Tax=Ferrovibrio sp. TaxID=1917215 RepID=UPI001B45310D|nr:D-glycerate dehydrogenase [Ferrovibrio sp.]MBP7066227.1 D-glycerate dehydrogenase [Ferrovibrio sp.]